MSPLHKLSELKQSWDTHTRDSVDRYAAMMTQVEALRVEVSALEIEIRRTERSGLPQAYKDARVRGLASRAAESYGQMLSLLRQAADIYPAVLTRRMEIPHTFSQRERDRLIHLPERPPPIGRREFGVIAAIGFGLICTAALLSQLFPVIYTLPGP